MLGSNMLISLVFQAINKTSGAFSQINGEFKRMDATVKAVSKRFEHLNNIGNKMMMAGAGMTIAGGGLAYSLGLTDAVAQARTAEHALRQLKNTGGMTEAQIIRIGAGFTRMSQQTNQYRADLIAGYKDLVAKGMAAQAAYNIMPIIGKTATATDAAIDDLSNSAFSMYQNLQLPIDRMTKGFEILVSTADQGGFELNNMARYLPSISAQAQSLGMQGVTSVAQLGAALQIAKRGAGTPEEAATNLQNFLTKIASKETVTNFKKFGVNVEAEMKKAASKGIDPLEHMASVIMSVTGGNKFKMSQIFGDMQVMNFLNPFLKDLEDYKKIRNTALTSSGITDKYFNEMMKDNINQTRQLKINMAALVMPAINAFFNVLNGVLTRLNGSSTGLKFVLGGVAALLGGGLLLSGLGFMFMGISNGIAAVKTLASVLRIAGIGIKAFSLISISALKTLGIALFTTPIGWIILGIMALVAAGYLLYRNWDKVSKALSAGWAWVKDSLQRMVKFISGISLFNIGKNIIESLWKGMKAMAHKPIDASVEIGSKIVSGVKGVLGIKSPSRVFIDVGRMISKGTEIGIGSGLPALTSAASAMARSAIAGFAVPRWAGPGKNSGSTVINYNPTVTISGQAAAAKDDFVAMLKQHKDEILRLVESARLRDARLAY